MTEKIYRVSPPWFPSDTVGIMLGDQDPHKAKGFLFSHSDETEEMMKDHEFVNHIIENQSCLERVKKRLAKTEVLLMKAAGFIFHYEDCPLITSDEKEACDCGHDQLEKEIQDYQKEFIEGNK